MREQLSALEQLQVIDIEISEIEKNLKMYPKEISYYNNELQESKERISNKRIELEELDKLKEQLEQNLESNKETIKSAENRLFEIKTHKEYEALQKEISEMKRLNSEIEEQIIERMEKIENIETEIENFEEQLNKKEEEYTQKIEDFEKKIDDLKATYEPKIKEKENLTSQIQPELLPIYEKAKRGGSTALAIVNNEMCAGCNMKIPPQLFNEVLKFNKIIQCPNCKKILYIKSED